MPVTYVKLLLYIITIISDKNRSLLQEINFSSRTRHCTTSIYNSTLVKFERRLKIEIFLKIFSRLSGCASEPVKIKGICSISDAMHFAAVVSRNDNGLDNFITTVSPSALSAHRH
jgi:hypothetical protein